MVIIKALSLSLTHSLELWVAWLMLISVEPPQLGSSWHFLLLVEISTDSASCAVNLESLQPPMHSVLIVSGRSVIPWPYNEFAIITL